MKKIGITGGIGCGKSFALEIVRSSGFKAIDADDLTRELWQDEGVVKKIGLKMREYGYLKEEFTTRAVRAVAKRAFGDMQVINVLETVLQPMILEKLQLWLKVREEEGEKVVFAVVPLLFECGLQYLFDETLAINAGNEAREHRLQLSRPLSAAEINLRINRQWADWARSRYATHTIENNGTKEEFKEAMQAFLREKL